MYIYIYLYTQNDLPEYPQGIFVLAPRTPRLVQRTPRAFRLDEVRSVWICATVPWRSWAGWPKAGGPSRDRERNGR